MNFIGKIILILGILLTSLPIVSAQNLPTIITSFNFNYSGSPTLPYAADGSFQIPNPDIVATATMGGASRNEDGANQGPNGSTGLNAFAFESVRGRALSFNNGDNYYQINLSGTTLSEYANYRVYCQLRRNRTGNTATIQYSTNGITFITLPSSAINLPDGDWQECLWNLSAIGAINNQSNVYFRVVISGGDASGHTRMDNFQVEAINTVVSCSDASLVSYMVNGCGSGCEGADEYLVLHTGSSTYDLNNLTVAWPDNGYGISKGYCHTSCGTWNISSNNFFTQLSADRYTKYNLEADCGSLMIAPPSTGILPPNSYVIVFVGCPTQIGCAQYDFSSFCSGPIYGIAMGNTTCNDGRFSNTAQRQWSIGVNDSRCGVYTQVYQMQNPCGVYPCTANGINYLDGSSNVGQAIAVTGLNSGSKVSDACLDPVPLPIELVDFQVIARTEFVHVNWSTASETNNDFFTVECSVNGTNWVDVGFVDGAGTTSLRQDYEFIHRFPHSGLSYYRLKQNDYDGAYRYSDIRSVNFDQKNELLYRINMLGQEVDEYYCGVVIVIYSNGKRHKIIQ